MEELDDKLAKRIAFLGMEESGKSTFLSVLQKKFGSLYNLKPTTGAQRNSLNILGYKFQIWDYGGQKIYRDEYIKKSHKFLTDNDIIYYFVDVQGDNIDESFEYFQQLMKVSEIKSIDTSRVFILIHKMDPDKRELPEIQQRAEEIKNKFGSLKNVTFFETSIYDYWSIINSFSQGLKQITVIKDLFKKLLKEFARATFSSSIILLEENLLILEKHSSNEENLQIAQSALKQFLNSWVEDSIKDDSSKRITDVIDFWTDIELENGKAYFQKFSFKDDTYFITCYSKNPKTEMLILKKLPELGYRVFEITKGYFS